MDSTASSLKTIGLGTVTICNALFTGVYTIFRPHKQPAVLVGSAALNSAFTTAVFFSCREFLITPLLVYTAPWEQFARRRQELGIEVSTDGTFAYYPPVTWSDIRRSKLLDSGLSGALTGGLIRGITSGRRAAFSGSLGAGVFCTLLQYGYNEAAVARLRYISQLKEEGRSAVERPAFVPRSGPQSQEPAPPVSMGQSLLRSLGLVPVSDEEYLDKLKKTREVYLRRIEKLERQIEEEKILEITDVES